MIAYLVIVISLVAAFSAVWGVLKDDSDWCAFGTILLLISALLCMWGVHVGAV